MKATINSKYVKIYNRVGGANSGQLVNLDPLHPILATL